MSTGTVYVTRIENEEATSNGKYILSIPHSILLEGLSRKEEETFLWSRYINTNLKGEL